MPALREMGDQAQGLGEIIYPWASLLSFLKPTEGGKRKAEDWILSISGYRRARRFAKVVKLDRDRGHLSTLPFYLD
ncbi:hypothetical protein PAAG_05462 [Paracoccidioides lutzii Pb01]|uniref:Uncharacterized protein n=1 Tax=Paracoccidioides lutzii (strain ATCC MYA-826 / Pb01) TaxID=502779 RepID=C1H3W9_PARBA|nr:hypothetical protein PAAG_05462 [Paracoccidioides lutzii Pb01]EEH34413.1 hypothetical protein PAAG_05462 [Paracoccidioides lutzii Pb01]